MPDVVRRTGPAAGRTRYELGAEGGSGREVATVKAHPLDSEKAKAEHRKLLEWYYYERDRQAQNRMDVAMDHDCYDGLQWAEEDKAIVESRNQMALVYNEVAPMVDWITGTQRRAPVDWKVLPRTEDDVQAAEVKTKVMKYLADVNKASFARSRAFADCVKGGIGWVDDGVRDDPTKEPIYSRYEDWRNVLHDSSAMDLMGEDARYIFRWRWVDEDIALAMFPDRADRIRREVEDWAYYYDPQDAETDWQGGNSLDSQRRGSGPLHTLASSAIEVGAQRRRIRLIECQWREPGTVKFVGSGPLRGALYDPRDRALAQAVSSVGGSIVDRIAMRVRVAVFTEATMLGLGDSMYRHNQFSLTPMVCFRYSRTRMPYGFVRRVRDVQMDLNKRASKANFMLNTNQIIGERGAVDDWDEAAEEAQNPQGKIIVNPGKRFDIRRDTDAATGQLQLMAAAAQQIQKSGGVTDENLGRKTNAISGEAIKARQMQGAVVTTEPFDNLRLSVQTQGAKVLSLAEQFITEERVIRLTGAQGKLDWVRINRPEVQPDGSVRWLDDITSSVADFVVAEADYAGTLRAVMFESMNQLAQKLPPEVALRFLRIAFDYSDLPNKQEIVDELRKITGETDPNKKMTPEEAAAVEQQMQQQSEMVALQRATAAAALEEQRGRAQEVQARAAKLMAEIQAMQRPDGADGGANAAILEATLKHQDELRVLREQSARQIEALSQRLAKSQADTTSAVLKIKTDADTAHEVARIKADSDERIAEISAASERQMSALMARIEKLQDMVSTTAGELSSAQQALAKVEKAAVEKAAAEKAAPPAAAPAPAADQAPRQPMTVVMPQPAAAAAKVKLEKGPDGRPRAAIVTRLDGTEHRIEVDAGSASKANDKGGE